MKKGISLKFLVIIINLAGNNERHSLINKLTVSFQWIFQAVVALTNSTLVEKKQFLECMEYNPGSDCSGQDCTFHY